MCFRVHALKQVPVVIGDPIAGVRRIHVSVEEHDKAEVTMYGTGGYRQEYPLERFALHMQRLAFAAPVDPAARELLLPYAPGMPHGPAAFPPDAAPGPDSPPGIARPVAARMQPGSTSRAPSGPSRTSGKELIRALSDASGLPPEKVRAKLRAAGLRAPYTDEGACRKALGVEPPKTRKSK